jgi:hypothetical protein
MRHTQNEIDDRLHGARPTRPAKDFPGITVPAHSQLESLVVHSHGQGPALAPFALHTTLVAVVSQYDKSTGTDMRSAHCHSQQIM